MSTSRLNGEREMYIGKNVLATTSGHESLLIDMKGASGDKAASPGQYNKEEEGIIE